MHTPFTKIISFLSFSTSATLDSNQGGSVFNNSCFNPVTDESYPTLPFS